MHCIMLVENILSLFRDKIPLLPYLMSEPKLATFSAVLLIREQWFINYTDIYGGILSVIRVLAPK